MYETEKDEPSDEPEGCAPVPSWLVSATAEGVHAESAIEPVWPPAVADAFVNVTRPKSLSVSGWQFCSEAVQADGDSAIHSALLVSGLLICRCESPTARSSCRRG